MVERDGDDVKSREGVFCSDFKERKIRKPLRMLVGTARRAGWHSEGPRYCKAAGVGSIQGINKEGQ